MRSVRSLPTQPTSFVGRAATVRLVCRRLTEHRIVSLVGPGGCGKTRLAVEVARRTTAFQPADVSFVDLSGLSDPELVPGTVLSALGLSESLGEGPLEALTSRLAERASLILLDNCEHLLEACAALVGTLTRECRGVRFLATSRECLGASGEGSLTWRASSYQN